MPRTILILADGARFDVMGANLQYLPNIKKLAEQGSFIEGTSVFPSTTGPAHLPMLTGHSPGGANLPGIRWFDRHQLYPEIGLGALRLRSYVGWKSARINKEIEIPTQNLFQLAKNPKSVFEVFQTGLPEGQTNSSLATRLHIIAAHFTGNYKYIDHLAIDRATEALRTDPDFLFLMLPGIDGHSHHTDPGSRATLSSYQAVDQAVGRLQEIESGLEGPTMWVICSDHGHSAVRGHIDIDDFLTDRGFRVACHSRRLFKFRPNAVVAVSGNGMAQIYLRGASWKENINEQKIAANWPGLIDQLIGRPEIDLCLIKNSQQEVKVISERGQALISRSGETINYRVLTTDPFSFGPLPDSFSVAQALDLTADSAYPDGIFQAVQIAESHRSGDIILSAAPGYDFRQRHEVVEHKSGHGALHRAHMSVPVICSEKLSVDFLRTTDIFATVCQWMGFPDQGLGVGRLKG